MGGGLPSSHEHPMTAHASAAAEYRHPDEHLDDMAAQASLPGGGSTVGPWFDSDPASNDGQSGPGQQRTSYELEDLFMDHAQRPHRAGLLSPDDRLSNHAAEGLPTARPCVRLMHMPSADPILDALSMSSPGIDQLSEQRHAGHFDDHNYQRMLTSHTAPRSHPIPFGGSGHLPADTALQLAGSQVLSISREDLPQASAVRGDPASHLHSVGLGSAGRSAGQQPARSDGEQHRHGSFVPLHQEVPPQAPFQPSRWPSLFNGMPDPYSEIRRLPEYPQPFAMPYHGADARASVAAENLAMSHHDSRRQPLTQYRLSFHSLDPSTSELQGAAAGSLTANDHASRSRPWAHDTPSPSGLRHGTHQEPQVDDDPESSLNNASGHARSARVWHPAPSDQDHEPDWLQDLRHSSERNAAAHALLGSDVLSNPPYASSHDEGTRLDDVARERASSRGGASSWMRPRAQDDAHFSMLARDAMEGGDPHAGLQDTLSRMRARLGLPFGRPDGHAGAGCLCTYEVPTQHARRIAGSQGPQGIPRCRRGCTSRISGPFELPRQGARQVRVLCGRHLYCMLEGADRDCLPAMPPPGNLQQLPDHPWRLQALHPVPQNCGRVQIRVRSSQPKQHRPARIAPADKASIHVPVLRLWLLPGQIRPSIAERCPTKPSVCCWHVSQFTFWTRAPSPSNVPLWL